MARTGVMDNLLLESELHPELDVVITQSRDGFRDLSEEVIVNITRLAADNDLTVRPGAMPRRDARKPSVHLHLVSAENSPGTLSPSIPTRSALKHVLCYTGRPQCDPKIPDDFDLVVIGPDVDRALAPLRLILPGPGPIGFDLADCWTILDGAVSEVQLVPVPQLETIERLVSGASGLAVGFSNRLRVQEISAALDAAKFLNDVNLLVHGSLVDTPTTHAEVLIARKRRF